MNRLKAGFGTSRKRAAPLAALLPLLLLSLSFLLFSRVSGSAKEEQQRSLEKALLRATAQCYALEGRYPESLSYLTEHYGVAYDSEEFFVDYQPVAENLLPVITVIPLGGTGQ